MAFAGEYVSYLDQLALPVGCCQEGEIELVTDSAEIARVEEVQRGRLLKKGFSPEEAARGSYIGVVAEDSYWIWLRDAVHFPGGAVGTYNRLLSKNKLRGGVAGVAVLPVLPSGKVVLNLNYRHATRSWELELPRGGLQPEETPETGAQRELREETGLRVSSLTFLGNIAPDTGVLASVVPIFLGRVEGEGEAEREESEAIAGTIALTVEEVKEGLKRGFLEVSVAGEQREVPLRDSFLAFAILQGEIRKMW